MLRSVFPAIRRNQVHLSSRRYHPLAANWSSPPAANLVPIVIEQTVSIFWPLTSYLFELGLYREEENDPMTFSLAFCANELSCFMDL
jgi:hypothetical protein